jgi:hypothetical protein
MVFRKAALRSRGHLAIRLEVRHVEYRFTDVLFRYLTTGQHVLLV